MTDDLRRPRRVLNAGSGSPGPRSLHPCFAGDGWRELRLDIDPRVEPDVVGSVTDLRSHFEAGTFDAIWSSHNVEHLYAHEVPLAFAEFRHVLKPDGFALVTCPDLQAVAAALLEHGPAHVAYEAPAGPITVQDMIFGHGASIAAGFTFMAHHNGFTQDRLGAVAIAAGFTEVRVGRGEAYALWALLAMPECSVETLRDIARGTHLELLVADPSDALSA
jgi:SAM-dependent methyltransferase